MNLKRTLQIERAGNDSGQMALLAWQILGGLVALFAVISIVGMIPEIVRYLKIKSL